MPDESPPPQLKEWFNEARYRSLAADLARLAPDFDRRAFLRLTLDGLDDCALMTRLRRTAAAADAALPGSYRHKVGILKDLAPLVKHGFVGIFLSEFVAAFGRQDPAFSLEALRHFTVFGSAEFAIRPFLVDDQPGTLATMRRWTEDENEHVRRLASEGCRPRLPWGQRLPALVRDPVPLGSILDRLNADPSDYVRKSVANNLNDISRDHPDWVLAKLSQWDLSRPGTAWIARHASRTLIKKGHQSALTLFGFGQKPALTATLAASPARIRQGDTLTLSATLTAAAGKPQRLAIDYLIHYVKASGATSPKVFKWTEKELAGGETLTLEKRQTIRDFTTRRHYPGHHLVELQINGHRVASTAFDLAGGSEQ